MHVYNPHIMYVLCVFRVGTRQPATKKLPSVAGITTQVVRLPLDQSTRTAV